MLFTFFLRPLRPWRLCGRYSEVRLQLFADRRTSFPQRSLGKSVYCYSSEFARLAQIFRGRKFSDLKIPPAKAQRRQVRRGKINIFTNSFQHFFRPLRPLRLRSGHAWRPFGRVYPELSRRAQDMLCGRYSEFRLGRGRAVFSAVKFFFSSLFGCSYAALGSLRSRESKAELIGH